MMRNLWISVTVLLLMYAAWVSLPATKVWAAEDDKAVEAAEMQMMMAVMKHDAEAFKAVSDVEYRTVNEDGSAGDLRDALAEMKSAPLKMDGPPEMSERLIRHIGDTALVSGRWKFSPAPNQPREIRYLEVWVKRGSAWKFAHWQATRITPEGLDREKSFKTAAASPK